MSKWDKLCTFLVLGILLAIPGQVLAAKGTLKLHNDTARLNPSDQDQYYSVEDGFIEAVLDWPKETSSEKLTWQWIAPDGRIYYTESNYFLPGKMSQSRLNLSGPGLKSRAGIWQVRVTGPGLEVQKSFRLVLNEAAWTLQETHDANLRMSTLHSLCDKGNHQILARLLADGGLSFNEEDLVTRCLVKGILEHPAAVAAMLSPYREGQRGMAALYKVKVQLVAALVQSGTYQEAVIGGLELLLTPWDGEVVAPFLRADNLRLQLAGVKLLAHIKGNEAAILLGDIWRQPKTPVELRKAAAQALAGMGTPESRQTLVRVTAVETNPAVKTEMEGLLAAPVPVSSAEESTN